jgi:hypothetical protein
MPTNGFAHNQLLDLIVIAPTFHAISYCNNEIP